MHVLATAAEEASTHKLKVCTKCRTQYAVKQRQPTNTLCPECKGSEADRSKRRRASAKEKVAAELLEASAGAAEEYHLKLKQRFCTALELGLAKSRSDCVNGDGAASSSGQDQFESPPNTPVSSSYSPLPSSEDSEEDPQTQTGMLELPVEADSSALTTAVSGASSSSDATNNSALDDNKPPIESQDPHSADEADSCPAGWKQWWASDAHYEREQERTDRVVRITNDAYAELENALPNSCPTFEAVLQFVEWTLVNNAHGQLMSIDMHLHQRVMDEFLVRGATNKAYGWSAVKQLTARFLVAPTTRNALSTLKRTRP